MEKTKIEDLFKLCDPDGRGVIGKDQLSSLCRQLQMSEADADLIFKDLDHDCDGSINLDEFTHGFHDFLTPSRRRGSLQLPLDHTLQLQAMEEKHERARPSWTTLSTKVGVSSSGNAEDAESLSGTLTLLMADVHKLNNDYRQLEDTFRRERLIYAEQLSTLGEEMDQQIARSKLEAREEASRQMEGEKKKLLLQMQSQIEQKLSSELNGFRKVEEWLDDGHSSTKKMEDGRNKLVETEAENRSLRAALAEAQTKSIFLQTQLRKNQNDYVGIFQELNSEREDYKGQVDKMYNQLSILSEANKALSDANDCFLMASNSPSPTMGPRSLESATMKALTLEPQDKDSGRDTLWNELQDNTTPKQRTFKIILVGDTAVGKTTFIERFCNGRFNSNINSTIGVDFRVKTLKVDESSVTLQIWDTAGQERFRSLTQNYYRRADGVVLMYDVTNFQTFLSTRNWILSVRESVSTDESRKKLPVILCGNKCDMASSTRSVPTVEAAKLATDLDALFMETSTKSGDNVVETFLLLARVMIQKEDDEVRYSVVLSDDKKVKRGCCKSGG